MQITFEEDKRNSRNWADNNGSYTEAYHCPINPAGIYIRDVDCTPGFGDVDEGFRRSSPCLRKECICITKCHIGVIPVVKCSIPCTHNVH